MSKSAFLGWGKPASLASVIVSWDRSTKAARAVGDALPLLQQARKIDIASIGGDPNPSKHLEGADIVAHLARYCCSVSVTAVTSENGDRGAALAGHSKSIRAIMLVMGAYAHSKLRQFVLGGVTSTMFTDLPVPVLMSY